MPNLLTLPRELRDEVYGWLLHGQLAMKTSRRPRIRVAKKERPSDNPPPALGGDDRYAVCFGPEPSSPHETCSPRDGVCRPDVESTSEVEYYEGEESIRYPSSQPLPPTDPLLNVNRQLRTEMQETIEKNPVRYKIRLSFRNDKQRLYPTWISMPALTDRVDTLDVEIRIRQKRTASLFSTTSSTVSHDSDHTIEGDEYFGGLVLLQRFLERGVSFLSKKKGLKTARPVTIGCMTLHVVPKDLQDPRPPEQVFNDTSEWVNDVLVDKDGDPYKDADWERVDAFIRLFAQRFGTFAVQVEGMRREWIMRDVILERDERSRSRQRRQEAGES